MINNGAQRPFRARLHTRSRLGKALLNSEIGSRKSETISRRDAETRRRRRGLLPSGPRAAFRASTGPVELPFSLLQPDRASLFVAGDGNQAGRPFAAMPLVAFSVKGTAVGRAYDLLATFRGGVSMARAIDRLGRSRLAINPVDRALELGMAAEIVLMHDHSPSNTEIAYKIGGRAAWLLGQTPAERATIFADMKSLYGARSQAVHSGVLSSRSTIDLDAADALVTRIFNAIIARGAFPDWSSLMMGGDALQAGEEEDGE